MKKVLLALTAVLSAVLLLVGCGGDTKKSTEAPKAQPEQKEIRVGVTAGPHEEVMEFVAKEAEKQGLKIKIVPFQDYVQPNMALEQKELEINSYQHQPFLNNAVKERGLHLTSIGKTILLPMSIFSNKYKVLADIPEGATVAIPNDPTNGGRGLLLLQQAGLIKLKDGADSLVTVADIVDNPKKLNIRELEAAQIVHSLNDVDFATVNTNYAVQAGLNPTTDALFVEAKESPYTNVIAVRDEDKDNPTYKKFVEVYQSEPVRQFVIEHFKGAIVPGF